MPHAHVGSECMVWGGAAGITQEMTLRMRCVGCGRGLVYFASRVASRRTLTPAPLLAGEGL